MVTNRIIFFATSVQPNPEEIDYWVDLSDNPYGGSIKYFNGTEWVRITASGDYNDLINKLKPGKDVSISEDNVISIAIDSDSLEQSLATLQSNIDKEAATARAAETKLGNDIATEKNRAQSAEQTISTNLQNEIDRSTQIDTQHTNAINKEVQDRKEAIATEVSDRNAAILVETNRAKAKEEELDNKITDHTAATNAALALKADKSDTYTKAQVDAKLSGAYKVKGSSTFEALPKDNNVVGDVYNITNAFNLSGKHYDAGTNVVWTEEGWDALSGSFDTTAIEGSIQEVADNLAQEILDRTQADTTINNNVSSLTNRVKVNEDKLTILQTQKVDKVEGKGLSTNDYTTPEKNKLAAIEAEANKYVLPAATASALGGVKIGSNITLADGGTISITKANVTSALGVDPTTTYVKKAGDTMTGTLTSASTTGSIVFKGVENSDITNIYKSGGNLSEGFGMHANADIINGLRFNWYDTFWYIGNIRGSGTESYGFGIVDNNDQIGFRVTTDAVYANKYTSSVSTGNAPISVKSTTMCPNLNADMVDGKNASDFQPSLYKTLKFTTNTSNSKVVWCDLCRIAQGYQNYSILVQISALQSAILCSVVVGYQGVSINILNSIIVSNYQFNQVYPTLRVVNRDNQSWLQCTFQQGITDQNNGNNLMSVNITTSDNKITLVDSLQEDTMEYTNAQIYGYASVSNNFGASMNIGSGEVVDWYGVQWSETSSNPDCTRIGNMEMHRTLPIQSMMKGYKVTTKQENLPYMLRKLEDDWSKTIGGYYGTTYDINFNGADTNIMVLIPEFWWIDDYSPSSKTHNLKICPHAKPGWNHHKEAFVGAYEGILTNNSFYSRKGVVPSVNVTREKLRTAARNNGNANEYKWNIYTYNEHRAICHLFLVEYATRNSQKAVNTELTPEGFRQGGLGSGCTTGTVTINRDQTWSFIPTGSSDSLGSGSGEVTVTIQQTDQSGSNTSTITRKCNRYRGIENPFGHIWKHTDDIISKYSIVSGEGYRSWSICENPINFSTNLTTKYTPICIEPVVTGYKTEIVITPTCDFFAHACTNRSESTYWCDYNWDNTDTSEHCLVIGGDSNDGGEAGLFLLDSGSGVGNSNAYIGSRLTYLPWAE